MLDLRGGRISLGLAGSGATPLATLLLESNGIQNQVVTVPIEDFTASDIDQILDRNGLDAAFVLGTVDSEVIEKMLSADEFEPVSFNRAAAYARLYPFLVEVTVPEGSCDLPQNLPDQDLALLATTVQLVAPDDVHPAIVDLLLEAAKEIHRDPTFFSARGEYPSMNHVSLPMDSAAVHFFEDGPPKLRKVLPYWASTLVDRFATFIMAILGAAVAIFTVLPRLLGLPLQISLKKWFLRLVDIEKESMAGGDIGVLIDRLDELDRESAQVHLFRFQLTDYIEYRQHIFDTRDRLRLRMRSEEALSIHRPAP